MPPGAWRAVFSPTLHARTVCPGSDATEAAWTNVGGFPVCRKPQAHHRGGCWHHPEEQHDAARRHRGCWPTVHANSFWKINEEAPTLGRPTNGVTEKVAMIYTRSEVYGGVFFTFTLSIIIISSIICMCQVQMMPTSEILIKNHFILFSKAIQTFEKLQTFYFVTVRSGVNEVYTLKYLHITLHLNFLHLIAFLFIAILISAVPHTSCLSQLFWKWYTCDV